MYLEYNFFWQCASHKKNVFSYSTKLRENYNQKVQGSRLFLGIVLCIYTAIKWQLSTLWWSKVPLGAISSTGSAFT